MLFAERESAVPKPIIQGPYPTFRRLNYEESYLEFEGSTITIPMRGRRLTDKHVGPWMEDEIKLNAFMRLEIFPAYVNNLGTREFQFIIRDWYLYGRSPMLNQLFFGDPRGRKIVTSSSREEGFVPATVTFNVSNNYDVRVLVGDATPDTLFAPARDLKIRNFTSHHQRSWVEREDEPQAWRYALPTQVIYWEMLPVDAVSKIPALQRTLAEKNLGVVIVFHKKPPQEGDFNVLDDSDRLDNLLAVGAVQRLDDRGPATFTAQEPAGLAINRVKLSANTTLSPLVKPHRPLQIRWAFAQGVDPAEVLSRKGEDGRLAGAIRIVSPARSLGTADQGPLPGEPPDSADFPARINYAINYDIAVNRVPFVEDQAGIATAVGASEVPPRDVVVAFDKPHLGHVADQYLEFGPGHCTGMHEISQTEYDENVNFARYWRTVPLDPDDSGWEPFKDFDPKTQY